MMIPKFMAASSHLKPLFKKVSTVTASLACSQRTKLDLNQEKSLQENLWKQVGLDRVTIANIKIYLRVQARNFLETKLKFQSKPP
jgi:hypothetical protein